MAAETDAHSPARVVQETLAVASAEIIDMIKSIRFAFLLVSYAFAAGVVGKAMIWINGKVDGKLLQGAKALSETEREMIVSSAVEQGMSSHLAEALINGDLPPLVFGVLLFSTFSIPALMLLVGYNRVSEDVSTRYTRYILQRVHRGSYLAGKLAGHWLVSFLAIVLVHIALLTYGYFFEFDGNVEVRDAVYEATLAAMPRIWLAMFILVLAYSAYTMLVSSTLNPPIIVLLLGVMGLVAIKFAAFILEIIHKPLGEIWMGSWDVRLYALDPAAIGVYLAYTVGFLGLATFVLRRRDL
jgi:hypothetical protein